MARVASFPPIAAAGARLLILGSMPGERSLAAREYYAHPQNAFWPLCAAILGFDPSAPYAERTARLTRAGIALWDVLASCERSGSLDAAIDRASARPNDFARFFAAHPGIRTVLCNGTTAHTLFVRRVLPTLRARPGSPALTVHRLPSTSPAHAGLTRTQKLATWRKYLRTEPGSFHH